MTSRRFIGRAFALAALALTCLGFPTRSAGAAIATNLPVLTHTKQVRDLAPTEALRAFPVR